ncbi:HlyD family efflux transporter periplasmic adaptor subunit [Brucepastera parasyntrophica]|uniref:HlyD family secretion protein n=1 Tax=Brucepastera parasyntrophica TaxID=2880008 RepID=UPI00210D86B2|nr:HlyD family efflux transporter periplasmic adaptor subunit [Brucepastera parasyntrophica]ULQ60270.1 HlyD family efflux transporter periplasmic adaptor subunit [Brucepastera parasyntrophica]
MIRRIKVVPPEHLIYSRELLKRREPAALHICIWVLVAVIVAAVCWIVFGTMEEVVRAQGVVRPTENVSMIRNVVGGTIKELHYKPGKEVLAGDILLQIDPEPLQAQKRSLETQLQDVRNRLEGAEHLVKSYNLGYSVIPKHLAYAASRFELYLIEEKSLLTQARMAQKLWEEEKNIPASGTTPVRIRELEYQNELYWINLEKHKKQFLSQILSERDSLLVEKENLESQLAQTTVNLDMTSLRSPVDGFVLEISSLNKDDYLQSGQEIIKIVPASVTGYKIDIQVPAKNAGRIKKDMTVKLRFPAFPYFEYRGATGIIQTVNPDATADSNGQLFFTVITDIDKTTMADRKGNEFPVRTGLEVDARIVLERKTILNYLLRKIDIEL